MNFQIFLAMAIQVTLIAAVALAAGLLLRHRAAARHTVLVCALVVIAIAPAWIWLGRQIHWPAETPIAAMQTLSEVAGVNAGAFVIDQVLPATTRAARWRAIDLAGVAWAAGSIVLVLRLAIGVLAARRMVRGSTLAGVIDGLEVRSTDRATGPICVGLFRPVVLASRQLLGRLSEAELRQVVAHEASHVRGRDVWVVLLQRIVSAAWWPSLFIWLLNRAIDRAREERCDNEVLSAGFDRADYARTLLHIADWMNGRETQGVVALALGRQSNLKWRIAGIANPRRNLMTRASIPMIVICISVFAGGAVLISRTGATARAQNAATTAPGAGQRDASLPLHEIQFDVGDADFLAGDDIKITQVLCTGEKLGIGEIGIVRGSYTLSSADEASIQFHVTASSPSSTPIDARQRMTIRRGSGTFELRHVLWDGYPHVSFYPAGGGSSFGGVYFGKGESLLKNASWTHKSSTTREARDRVGW